MEHIEIEVPSSLSDITLEQYQKWAEVVAEDSKDSSYLDRKLVEVFCDIEASEVSKIKVTEYSKILSILETALTQKVEELIPRFKMKGIEYGFIPNMDKLSVAEYTDIEKCMNWEDFHIALAALYRPVKATRVIKGKEQYVIEPYEPTMDKAWDMLDIPVDVAMSARVFFYTLSNDLLKTILNSLHQSVKKTKDTRKKRLLESNGDGIVQFMDSQTEFLKTLTMLPLNPFRKQ